MSRQNNYSNPLGNYGLANPYLLNTDDPYGIGAKPTPTMQALRPPIPQRRFGTTIGINVRPAFTPKRYTPDFSGGVKPNFQVGKTQPNYSRFISDAAEMPTDLGTSTIQSAPGRRSIGGKYADFVSQVGSLGNPSASFLTSPLGKFGTQAGQMGQANAISNFAQRPTLRSGITSAATYAFNANPYYAGINALTGGALDRGVGSFISGITGGNRRKAPGAAEQEAEIDYARRMNDAQSRYMDIYKQQRRDQEQANQELENYRTSQRNLATFGMSDRSMAGALAAMLNPANRAAEAARANVAAGMSQRGVSGGIAEGARSAVEGSIAQAGAQAGSQMAQDIQNRSFQMQDALANIDAQRRNVATQTAMQALGQATEIPMAIERQRMAQQQADYARDEQMYQRRFGEQQMLAQGLGAFAPELFDLFKRRGQQEQADTGLPDDAGMLPESDFGQVGGRATYRDPQGTLRFFDSGQEVLRQTNVSPAGLPAGLGGGVRPITTPTGQTVYQMPDGTIFDSNGEMVYSPAGAAYEARFQRPVEPDTEITLRLMNPNARNGEYAMNKPPQLANQEFRRVNGRWMKM